MLSRSGNHWNKYSQKQQRRLQPLLPLLLHPVFHKMSFSSYYKGGFEQKMSRREASLILGIRWISLLSNKNKRSKRFVRLQHQKLMSKDFCDRTFYTFLSTENPVDILCNSYVLLYIAA
ncbi:dnaJ homolog subfamily C member 15 isoform X5 [Mauremys reevesii]|nr:dnaJ homolog subfamily C member 15 isoform X5 [Mauremys reevesii]